MVASARVGEIFADARVLYIDALEMLEQGRLRNASEKAWALRSDLQTHSYSPAPSRSLVLRGRPDGVYVP